MSICMVGGLLVSSIITGRIITATGLWKRSLVGGMVLVIVGLALLSTIDDTHPARGHRRSSWPSSASASAPPCRTSCSPCRTPSPCPTSAPAPRVVAFFRSMGGSIGVSALGAVLGHQVADAVKHGPGQARRLARSPGARLRRSATRTGASPTSTAARADPRLFESAFGDATGHLFLIALPFAVVALLAVLFIKEVPLRTSVLRDDELAAAAAPEATAEQ